MRGPLRLSASVLFLCVALTGSARAQSLSVTHQGDRRTNYWIQASAPQDTPYTLQATGNLHLWVSLQDQIQGQYSAQLAGVAVTQRVMVAQLSQRFFRLTPTPAPPPPIRFVMIGDSMTADCCGWGLGMYGFFNSNATVLNYATAWQSTKSFLTSVEMSNMLLVKPDYVIVQFGYMDQAENSPDRYTTLQEFGDNLKTIVNMIRGFNGVPILVTLHSARIWDANGNVIPTWGDRNAVTKDVAAELKTPLIDLNQLTMDLFNQLGPNCNSYFHWPGGEPADVLHTSATAAPIISQLVVNALPDSLGPYLTGVTLTAPVIPAF